MYKVLEERPMTVRYLDPPLHEFLPQKEEEINELARSLEVKYSDLKNKVDSLKEFNPMMGHRGCRLAVTYPEIAVMQTKAVIEAGIMLEKENTIVEPEIMIPLIGDINELKYVKHNDKYHI